MTTCKNRAVSDWTRRRVLASAGAAGILAATGSGLSALPPQQRDVAALRRLCRAVVSTPAPARLGAALASGRDPARLEADLVAHLAGNGPIATEADLRGTLVAAARRDAEEDRLVEIRGLQLTRTEAEVLALGHLLGAPDAA